MLLFYLAPLPILIAALGWSHWAGLIAALLGAAGLAAVLGFYFLRRLPDRRRAAGLVARLSRAAGAPVAARGERQRRRLPSNGIRLGRLVLWAAIIGALIGRASRCLSFGTDQESFQAGLRSAFERAIRPQAAAGDLRADARGLRPRLIDMLVLAMPPAAAVLADAHQRLQSLARRPHREAVRPAAPAVARSLRDAPSGLRAGVLAAAVAGSFLPGLVGVSASVLRGEPADGLRDPRLRRAARDHPRHEQPRRSCSAAPMRPSSSSAGRSSACRCSGPRRRRFRPPRPRRAAGAAHRACEPESFPFTPTDGDRQWK